MIYPFNETKDKITESELVYDIIERLKFGNNHTNNTNDNLIIKKDTKLSDIILFLMNNIFNNYDTNISDIKMYNLHIDAGTSNNSIIITNLKQYKLVKAISSQTGMDYTELITIKREDNNLILSFTCSDSLYNDEDIKLYVI